jgi:hypothetical protein
MTRGVLLLAGMTGIVAACQSREPWVDERCGPWLEFDAMTVDLTGPRPRARWPALDYPTPRVLSVFWRENPTSRYQAIWRIEGALPDEVVYSEVPDGATELVAPEPLVSGDHYEFFVRILDYDLGMYCAVSSESWVAP